MTREELRVFLEGWFCGCGNPDDAAARLCDLLTFHPLYENRGEFERLVPDSGIQHLLLYMLDHLGLTEHGGSVMGAWLSDKGKDVLTALERERSDNFEILTEGDICMHGYTFGQDCPECEKLNAGLGPNERSYEPPI